MFALPQMHHGSENEMHTTSRDVPIRYRGLRHPTQVITLVSTKTVTRLNSTDNVLDLKLRYAVLVEVLALMFCVDLSSHQVAALIKDFTVKWKGSLLESRAGSTRGAECVRGAGKPKSCTSHLA